MNERPRRYGLQAWLVASFVAMGLIASLAVMLVVLPTLESSIRTEQADRKSTRLNSSHIQKSRMPSSA